MMAKLMYVILSLRTIDKPIKAKKKLRLLKCNELNYQYLKKKVYRVLTSIYRYRYWSYQIKSSLYSPYYAEACNELQGPSPRLSAWTTQLRRNVAAVASRWQHCVDLTGPGIEPQTSRTDSVRLATELTAGLYWSYSWAKSKDKFFLNLCS